MSKVAEEAGARLVEYAPVSVSGAAVLMEGLLSEDSPEDKDSSSEQEAEETPSETESEGEDSESEVEETEESEEEPNEDSESDDEDSEDADEPEAEDEEPEADTRPIVVDGKEIERVNFDQAVKGYMRTADYTRKTQAVAEKDKALEAERVKLSEGNQSLAQKLKDLDEALTQITPQEPDWAEVQANDPEGFPQQYAAWQLHKENLSKIKSERAEAERRVFEETLEKLKAQAKTAREELLEAIPEWKDGEKMKAGQAELVEFGKSLGYTEEDMYSIMDPRAILMMRDAMLYRRAKSKTKPSVQEKIAAAKVKAVKPGAKPPKGVPAAKGRLDARKKLAKTGRVQDAASVMMEFVD